MKKFKIFNRKHLFCIFFSLVCCKIGLLIYAITQGEITQIMAAIEVFTVLTLLTLVMWIFSQE